MATALAPTPPTISLEQLRSLALWTGTPCVTIMLPIDRRHPNDRLEHGILAKLIAEARAGLSSWDVDVERLLAPIVAVLERRVIAEHGETVAFFCSPGHSVEIELGTPSKPVCVVGNRFEVSPLLANVDASIGGHVLTIGADHVHLYHIESATLHDCVVDELPRSVDEALWYERFERHSGAHTGGPVGQGKSGRIGHGSGAQAEDRKERLDRFFQHIDRVIIEHLGADHEHPLIVAGTAPALARYRALSHHPWVVTVDVGSAARISLTDLRKRVAARVSSGEALDDLVGRLNRRLGTGLAGVDLAEVIEAAADGRVANLFVGSADPWWGRWPDSVERLDDHVNGSIDLINLAVSFALRSRATVHLLPPDRMPEGAALAAIYRY